MKHLIVGILYSAYISIACLIVYLTDITIERPLLFLIVYLLIDQQVSELYKKYMNKG